MALTPVVVYGTVRTPTGELATGQIDFQLVAEIQDPETNTTVAPVVISAPLIAGVFSVTLYATNDAGVVPSGVTYRVVERITKQMPRLVKTILLTTSMGSGVEYADLVTVEQYAPADGITLAVHAADVGLHGVGSGRSLGRNSTTTGASAVSPTGGLVETAIPALTTEVTATGRDYRVVWGGWLQTAGNNGTNAYLNLYEDNVLAGSIGAAFPFINQASQFSGLLPREEPAAGEVHLYTVRVAAFRPGGFTATAIAIAAATFPLLISVIEE